MRRDAALIPKGVIGRIPVEDDPIANNFEIDDVDSGQIVLARRFPEAELLVAKKLAEQRHRDFLDCQRIPKAEAIHKVAARQKGVVDFLAEIRAALRLAGMGRKSQTAEIVLMTASYIQMGMEDLGHPRGVVGTLKLRRSNNAIAHSFGLVEQTLL